jgi:hypothetical protein
VAEAGAVEEAADNCYAVVQGFNEEVGSGEGGHGELEFIQVGGTRKLVSEGGGGIEELVISDRVVGCV